MINEKESKKFILQECQDEVLKRVDRGNLKIAELL